MKYLSFAVFFLGLLPLFAIEHPITFRAGTEEPASFRTPGLRPDGVRCVTNAKGEYVLRINARGVGRKVISEERIKAKEGDTLTLKLTVLSRTKGLLAFGFYLYKEQKGKYRPMPGLFRIFPVEEGKKVYTFTKAIPRLKKKKGVIHPDTAVIFMDAAKGLDLDVEKVEYFIKKASPLPQKKAGTKAKTKK